MSDLIRVRARKDGITYKAAIQVMLEEAKIPSKFECPFCKTVYEDRGSARTRTKRRHYCRGNFLADCDFVPNEAGTDIVCIRRPTERWCGGGYWVEKNEDTRLYEFVEINHPNRRGRAVP